MSEHVRGRVGIVMVLVKGVNEDKPFYAGWQPVFCGEDGWWTVKRPDAYRPGVGGIHYKVLKGTFIPRVQPACPATTHTT